MKGIMILFIVLNSFGAMGGDKPLKDTTINGCNYTIYGDRKGNRFIYVRKEKQPLVTYKAYLLDSGRVRLVFYKGYQTYF